MVFTVPTVRSDGPKMGQCSGGRKKGPVGVSFLNPVAKSITHLSEATRSNTRIFEGSYWRSVLNSASTVRIPDPGSILGANMSKHE